jgi:hypothetical protein
LIKIFIDKKKNFVYQSTSLRIKITSQMFHKISFTDLRLFRLKRLNLMTLAESECNDDRSVSGIIPHAKPCGTDLEEKVHVPVDHKNIVSSMAQICLSGRQAQTNIGTGPLDTHQYFYYSPSNINKTSFVPARARFTARMIVSL